MTVIADAYNGKRLNSPNDVVAHHDGSIWFTDPPYGGQLYEGAAEAAQCNCPTGNCWTRVDKTRTRSDARPVIRSSQVPDPNGLLSRPTTRSSTS